MQIDMRNEEQNETLQSKRDSYGENTADINQNSETSEEERNEFEDSEFMSKDMSLDDDFDSGEFIGDEPLDDMPIETSRNSKITPEARRNIEDILEEKRLKKQLEDVFEEEYDFI